MSLALIGVSIWFYNDHVSLVQKLSTSAPTENSTMQAPRSNSTDDDFSKKRALCKSKRAGVGEFRSND